MEHQPTTSSPVCVDVQRDPYAVVQGRYAVWRQLLPAHRLPVIAKTPVMVLVGVYVSGGRFESREVLLTMLLAACLWTVLYALNESTDLVAEEGYLVEGRMKALLMLLCLGICGMGEALSPTLGLLLILMATGQIAYCVPPMRLKRYWWAVLLLSGALNPVLRLECGAMWGTRAIPLPAYAVFVSLHLGASIRARSLQRRRDAKLGYRIAPPHMERLGIAFTGIGLAGGYGLIGIGILPPFCALFTTIAAAFAVYAWSSRGADIGRLRRGWLLFALLGLVTLAVMLLQRLLPASHVWERAWHEDAQRLR